MKQIRNCLLPFSMLLGITSVFAFKNNQADCPWPLYYRISGGGPFVAQGTIAADQNPTNYSTVAQSGYACLSHFITCTYYYDQTDGNFKQCNEGEYIAD